MEIIETILENEVLTVIYHELNTFNEWEERSISIEDIELEKFIRRKSKSDESFTEVLEWSLNYDMLLGKEDGFFDINLFIEYTFYEEVLLDFIQQ